MANPGNLTRQLAAAADALGPVMMPVEQQGQLVDLCTTIRLAVGAASVSIARIDGRELLYEAADGAGARNVTGLRLPSNSGIAGYVAHTGQSLVVDEVQADPHEWDNLAMHLEHAQRMAQMRGFAPKAFADPEPRFNARKDLVIEGESYRWELGAGNYTPPPKYLPYTTAPAPERAKPKRK